MSLQVWLPLNGDLKNQGLSANITMIGNAVTTNNDGKIGKCYSFNGSTSYLLSSSNFLDNSSVEFSYACWAKFNNFTNIVCLFSSRASAASTGLTIFIVNGTTIYFDQGSRWTITLPSTLNVNEWYHFCFTWGKNGKARCYLNGELKAETNTGTPTTITNRFAIGGSQKSAAVVNTHYLNGYLNDVRIYDHCLSTKEVEEISKGLILHYKLDQVGTEDNNLLQLIPKSHDATAYCSYQLNLKENLQANQTYTMQLWDVTITHTGKTASNIGLSVYWGGGNIALKTRNGPSYYDTYDSETYTAHFDYASFQFTPTQANAGHANATNAWLNIYNSVSSANGTRNMHIGAWKLEIGSTPTRLATGENIVYDCSGYRNNGTIINTLTINADSSRYNNSIVFNGSNSAIAVGRGPMVKDAISVCCWGYMNDWSSYNRRLLSCTEGGGWNFEPSSGKMNFAMGTGASSNTYKGVVSNTTLASLNSGWHHFVGTYDGFSTKIYIDGQLDNTFVAYSTKTPIYYHTSNGIFIGAEAGSSATTPVGNYFNGRLSDVRIYATALTDEQVKELYNTSSTISNLGDMFSREFDENNNLSITKTGIFNNSKIIDGNYDKASILKTKQIQARNLYEY